MWKLRVWKLFKEHIMYNWIYAYIPLLYCICVLCYAPLELPQWTCSVPQVHFGSFDGLICVKTHACVGMFWHRWQYAMWNSCCGENIKPPLALMAFVNRVVNVAAHLIQYPYRVNLSYLGRCEHCPDCGLGLACRQGRYTAQLHCQWTVGCSRQFWRSRQIWRSSPN